MEASVYHFPTVALLITHYNRSASLERLLNAFALLNCSFGQIVVSDDGSKPEHQQALLALQQQYDFTLVTTPQNGGLGNNINKGQDAVTTPYTLYVQEDFVPKAEFPARLTDAWQLLEEDPGLDIARFYAYFAYPYQRPYARGFGEMLFHKALWYTNHIKFYVYSDHPHLRRSSFLQKFGRYAEGLNVDKTEFQMCLSFLKHKGRGIFYREFTTLFDQVNSHSEPSTASYRGDRKYDNAFWRAARRGYLVYRLAKNTVQLARFPL